MGVDARRPGAGGNFAFDGSACGAILARQMFEQRRKPLLPRRAFYARMARSLALAIAIVAVSLGMGMLGYHCFENLPWLDAFLNASMILSGMGPVATLQTAGGKFFAGCYALFSGLALIAILGIIFAPVVHRSLHRFHLEDEGLDKKSR